MSEHICDFCFLAQGRHRYVATDPGGGWWIACDHCRALIEEGNRYGLVTRGITLLRERIGDPTYAIEAIRGLHDQFWSLRDVTVSPFTELPEAVTV